jgi:hypothetical protein
MVAEPAESAVARPVGLIETMDGALEVQVH